MKPSILDSGRNRRLHLSNELNETIVVEIKSTEVSIAEVCDRYILEAPLESTLFVQSSEEKSRCRSKWARCMKHPPPPLTTHTPLSPSTACHRTQQPHPQPAIATIYQKLSMPPPKSSALELPEPSRGSKGSVASLGEWASASWKLRTGQ